MGDIIKNIEEHIRTIMASILATSPDNIEDDSAIGDIEGWNSLNHMKILSAIEKEFGIEFTPDVLMDIEDFSDMVRATKEACEE